MRRSARRAWMLAAIAAAIALAASAGAPEGGAHGETSAVPAAERSAGVALRSHAPGAVDNTGWNVVANPIDPFHQTALGFCDRSYWLQPWRAYLDTPPASRLLNSAGLNLNVGPEEAPDVLALMRRRGFTRARMEFGWDAMSAIDTNQLRDRARILAALRHAKASGVRPLLLLNANHGMPGPGVRFKLDLALPALKGSRVVHLRRDSVGGVVPGLTGLDGPGIAAETFITAVRPNGIAALSQPLPRTLGSGPQPATTLRFHPFSAPYLPGTRQLTPAFKATLGGWLDYVGAVTRAAKEALGSDAFDVEVWNELSFGSNFLGAENYYEPVPPELTGEGDVKEALLQETVRFLRDPANGVPRVGIGDGFSNQTPFASGATSPPGLTALDKHPYSGPRTTFDHPHPPRPCRPLDALGRPEGREVAPNSFADGFTPTFTSYFPEYYLNAIQTEHLIRDLSPITTEIRGVPHGRTPHPGGATGPELWVTEMNMDPELVTPGLADADVRHMQAKSALRTLVSFVNKGVTRVDFYTAAGRRFGFIDPAFLNAARAGDADLSGGGEVMDAVGRLMAHVGADAARQRRLDRLRHRRHDRVRHRWRDSVEHRRHDRVRHRPPSADRIRHRRRLSLISIADQANRLQFDGDGTAAHPPLHDRDVVGVFPFQTSDRRFVVPVYVMTRDVARLYDASAPTTALARYDLPPEPYRLQIGGVTGRRARVSAYDPLKDASVRVGIVARSRRSVTVELDVTDSPRLLRIAD